MAEVDCLRAIGPFSGQLAAQLRQEGVSLLGLKRGKRSDELLCLRSHPSCELRSVLLGLFDQAPRDLLDGIASGMSRDQQHVGDLQVALASAPFDWRYPQIAHGASDERRMHVYERGGLAEAREHSL